MDSTLGVYGYSPSRVQRTIRYFKHGKQFKKN